MTTALVAPTTLVGHGAPRGHLMEAGTVYDAIARTSAALAGRDGQATKPGERTTRVDASFRGKGAVRWQLKETMYGD